MNKEELRKFVEENPQLVSRKPAGDGIFVLKYKKRCFYDSIWNEFINECRGTVIDADYNIVSYPFTKIHNYGIEKEAPQFSDDTLVNVFRKVNGFMVSATWHDGDVLVSTTGSTSGDFVDMAKEMMLEHMPWADWQMALMTDDCRDLTFMFECCHKNDPHIIPESEGMYILGYREKCWGSTVGHNPQMLKELGELFKCHVPEHFEADIAKVKELVKSVRHEGFILYDMNGVGTKIKSPYYLVNKWVARNPRTDKLVDLNKDIKQNLDEEYYPLIDKIRENIVQYTELNEQERLAWVRKEMEIK